jgi:putative ABC transport system permease protein
MMGNHLKIAWRNIVRHKGYSFLNIFGLAVGIACCALMMLWISHEGSFDRFHVNRDSVYRVIKETANNGQKMSDARTPYPLGPAIGGKVPGIVNYCRYQGFESQSLKYGTKLIALAGNLATADPSFFEMFTFPFVQGDPKTALKGSHGIVLTESTARILFGDGAALGKTLTYPGGWGDFEVTGVMRDIPENSHIQFDCIVPIKDIAPGKEIGENDWKPLFFYTYVQLAPQSRFEAAALKIAAVLNENIPDLKAGIVLQPLKGVHLDSNFEWDLDNYAQGSRSTLTIFTLAAIGVLLLAMINFMNLSTARSANRAKEVGLRKVCGARRTEIVVQFLGESVLLAFLGLFLALVLVFIGLPSFNELLGKKIAFASLFAPSLIMGLLGITLLTGLVSGSYPSFFLSAFQPARVLKGGAIASGRGQAAMRKGLVVFQFALTLFLVMGSAVVNRQLKFIREKNLGMDTHNVITFFMPLEDDPGAISAFLANPNVLDITRSDPPQIEQRGMTGVSWEGKNPGAGTQFFPVTVDASYLQTFRIGLAEGRFFSRRFPSDVTESLVLNETAVQAMGFTSPIGKRVTIDGSAYTVIGVVKDFHQSSLHRPIAPMIIRAPRSHYFMCARINPINFKETIAFLEATAKKFEPRLAEKPFKYEFLDDRIDGFYSSERKVEAVLGLFTAIAMVIACLGLFGLTAFTAEKRTKEIGIRKVLGATVPEIIILLSREFVKWVAIAALIAWPLAYFAMGRWLQGFAYRTGVGIGLFFLCSLLALLIAIMTVSLQAVRAARQNPVDSLRYE